MIPFRAAPVDCNPRRFNCAGSCSVTKNFSRSRPDWRNRIITTRPLSVALLSLAGKHFGHNGPVEYVRRIRVGVGHVFGDHIVAHTKERRQPGRFGIGLQFDSLQTGRADRGTPQFAAASQQPRPTSIAAAAGSQAALPMQNPLRAQYRRPADGDGHFQSHRTR